VQYMLSFFILLQQIAMGKKKGIEEKKQRLKRYLAIDDLVI